MPSDEKQIKKFNGNIKIKDNKNVMLNFGKSINSSSVFEDKDDNKFIYKTGFANSTKENNFGGASLFLERTIYLRLNKIQPAQGIPKMHSFGLFTYEGDKYRYIKLPRYEMLDKKNLNSLKIKNIIPEILDILKKIHNLGYVHCDIKPENLMLDSSNNIVLIDYDCSTKHNLTKNKNNICIGTEEFMSRDIYEGIVSYKVDIESLFYVVIKMLLNELSWENKKTKNCFKDKVKFFSKNGTDHFSDKSLIDFFEYIKQLKDDNIDYQKIKSFFN